MQSLSAVDRRLLASRQIMTVNEPWLGKTLPQIPHKGRRVLVPTRLASLFATITQYDKDAVLSIDVHKIVERLARTKVDRYYRATAPTDLAPKGYSCSTLTYWVYAFAGLSLPRYAIDQSYVGHVVTKATAGGLAFYRNRFPIEDRDRAIGHVGIITNKQTIIHGSSAARKVVEETIPYGAVLFTDPFPKDPQILIIVPNKIQGITTALDLARWLERPLRI